MSTLDSASKIRHFADYHPSLWGDYFLTCVSDLTIDTTTQEHHKELKEEVRKMITTTTGQKGRLQLIDEVQRLGVSYHFEKEIEDALVKIFHQLADNYVDDGDDDLYTVSLRFRLLRQQGIKISCDVFNKFKNEEGKYFFKESLKNDVQGMLGLYEAVYLRIRGEEILDEAIAFTTAHLKSMIPDVCPNLAQKINHTLYHPLRKVLPRIEARDFFDIYAKDDLHNQTLLKFAKLDFNIVQAEHQKELSELTRWCRNSDFNINERCGRDRLVELYFWVMGIYFEPKYTFGRISLTKIFVIITIIDDTFDAYGTLEELQLFTEAVKRWDIGAIDILPEYMKIIYKTLLDIQNEIVEELAKEGRSRWAHYAKEKMQEQIEMYFAQAKWLNEGYVPTMEEYMSVALLSIGSEMAITYSFLGMGDSATEDAFKWVFTNPKALKTSSIICRLLNDIAGHELEKTRVHNPTAVECCMKQFDVSKEAAVKMLNQKVENEWKDMNEEFLTNPTAISLPLLERTLNTIRSTEFMYKDGHERFSNSYLIKDQVASLLKDPVML